MLLSITCLNCLVEVEEICGFLGLIMNKVTSIATLSMSFIEQKIHSNDAHIDIVDTPKRIF